MSDLDRPSIFSLTPEARRAEYDAAHDRVAAAASEMAKQFNARRRDPRSRTDYLRFHAMGLVCVLVVKHRDKPASIECSRDGSHYPPAYLPNSKTIILPESTRDFILALVPKWLAQRAELMGVTLQLSPSRVWMPAQEEQWETLRKARNSINTKIYFARRRPSLFTRDQVA